MRAWLAAIAATMLAVAGCSSADDPAPVRGDARTVLDVPHIRQEPMLCVPTSAAMVLAFYGDPRPPRMLKTLASGHRYDPSAPFDDFTITHFRDLLRAMRQLGYDWAEQSFPDDDAGFRAGVAVIEAELRDGHPVLVDATVPTGHTFVVRGFDTAARELFIVDPDQAARGRTLSYDAFEALWNEHAFGNHVRALITTRPSSGGTPV